MLDGRYKISAHDDYVELIGEFTMEEIFDFLAFYDKKGYVRIQVYSSGLNLYKKSPEDLDEQSEKLIPERNVFEVFYEEEKALTAKLQKKIIELSDLLAKLLIAPKISDEKNGISETNKI